MNTDSLKTLIENSIRITIILCVLSITSAAQAEIIDYSESFDRKSPPELRLHFTQPVQYISHFPRDSSDETEIQIRLIQTSNAAVLDINKDQRISGEYSKAVPTTDIRYEPGSTIDRGIIRLRFKRRVNTMIRESSDKRVLIITLPPDAESNPQSLITNPTTATAPVNKALSKSVNVKRYVVNLKSSTRKMRTPEILQPQGREDYVVYMTKHTVDEREWQRLRVGFFATKTEAIKFLGSFKHQYPDAWIAKASLDEIDNALKKTENIQKTEDSQPTIAALKATRLKTSDDRINKLMEEARQAVSLGNLSRAVQLYTKILEYPDHPYRQDALEFLGVAREKKGQIAHAISEYRRYLTIYPEGESADRVKQRLAGLTTASKRITSGRRNSASKPASNPWDFYGGISTFYRRDEDTTENVTDSVTQSSLFNDIDLNARKRTSTTDMKVRFTGSYLSDFLDDSGGDETSVSSLYLDITNKKNGLNMRAGRQSRSTGGVLGRVDGVSLGYKMTDKLTLNSIVGFPVLSTRDQVKTDRYLYGVSADLGTYANAWDFNAFIIEQKSNDILDRRAIGGEARYFETNRSLLTYIDYDISYTSLNTLLMIGTWRLKDKTTLNASLDYRNSPILTTTNAIISVPVDTFDDLQDLFSDSQIRKLAENRSSESKTFTIGVSRPLNEKLQFNADMTISNFSSTKGSDLNGDGIINTDLFELDGDGLANEMDIQPIPGTGNEYFYNFQLIGNSLLKSGDTGIIGVRFFDTKNSNTTSLSLNSRYPVNNLWRVNPRFRVDYRENTSDDSTQWVYSPQIRTDYRWRKHYRFEFELGGEWSNRELSQGDDDTSSFYYSLGFRADF